jgi:hypothetical protein
LPQVTVGGLNETLLVQEQKEAEDDKDNERGTEDITQW